MLSRNRSACLLLGVLRIVPAVRAEDPRLTGIELPNGVWRVDDADTALRLLTNVNQKAARQ
jgi:hypothetical protein